MGARYKQGAGAQRARETSRSFLVTGIRVASRRLVYRGSISGIAGGRRSPLDPRGGPIRRLRLIPRRAARSSPYRPLRALCCGPRAMHAPDACRVDFISLGACSLCCRTADAPLTVTGCEIAADLLHAGSRALLVESERRARS